MDGPCPACGASWECEHRTDPARADLEYVPPDGLTLGEYHRYQFNFAALWLGIAAGYVEMMADGIRDATQAVQGFLVAWDALPEATKAEIRRLDAST